MEIPRPAMKHGETYPLEYRFYKHKQISGTCWLWTGCKNKQGYGMMGHKQKTRSVHRVSFEYYKHPIPEGMDVCHTCDVPNCFNPDHLWLGSHKENMQDAVRKNRRNHKITNEQRLSISTDTRKLQEIADEYGVSFQYVSRLRKQKYGHSL